MRTVTEVSKITGVSVRTLHHYDAVGLLKPTAVTEAGYRLYDDAALARLHSILMFRELQFPLKEIRRILDTPGFDRQQALEQQIELLKLQRARLDRLIVSACELQIKGERNMDFSAFDRSEWESYAAEAKERWGKTEAYQQFSSREDEQQGYADEMMQLFTRFGSISHQDAASPQAQALAGALQQFISDHFYTCTKPILKNLGQMYTADERFRENIDRAGGDGTAAFVCKVLEVYCG